MILKTHPNGLIKLPNLYPRQDIFANAPSRFTAFVGGIGSGKTTAGALRGLRASYGQIGDQEKLQFPNLGMVTAPTYTMLKDASLRTFLEIAESANLLDRFYKNEMLVRLENGSEVLFRSAHAPERLRGPSLAWWWGDESALYDALVWPVMIGRLRQFSQPGYAWVTSTPRGKNWLYKVFVRDNADNPDYALIHARSADNIYLDEAIIRAWEQSYVGDFALQELDGQFVAHEGLVYPEFEAALHITSRRPDTFTRVLAGVDWGLTHPGVIVVAGTDYDQRLYFVLEEVQRNRLIEDWVRVAVQLRELWHIEAFYCDPSNPDNIAAFERAGLRTYKAKNTISTGIQRVKARLMRQVDGLPRLFIAPTMTHAIREFESYHWAYDRHGVSELPLKANDHLMDAIRYLTMAVDSEDTGIEAVSIDVDRWA